MLGLRFCARAFSSCGKWGPLFIVVRGPLIIAASLVAEHRLQTRRLQKRRLSSCGSRAQLLRGMWDLPGPGLEPVSPASAGRFSTTAPPGKPPCYVIFTIFFFFKSHKGNPPSSFDYLRTRFASPQRAGIHVLPQFCGGSVEPWTFVFKGSSAGSRVLSNRKENRC